MMSYWLSGVAVDQSNNVKLGVVIGKGHNIPADEITIMDVPDGLLSPLIRTNEQEFSRLVKKHKGTIYSVCLMFAENQDEANGTPTR